MDAYIAAAYLLYYLCIAGAVELQSEDSDEEGYVINSINHDRIQAQYLCGQLLCTHQDPISYTLVNMHTCNIRSICA